jgi:hypothetical protein
MAGPTALECWSARHFQNNSFQAARLQPCRLELTMTGTKKMRVERPFLLIAAVFVGLVMLAAPVPAFSQSCALCYTQAASAGNRMIQALQSGILVLIVPPTLMSVGMIFIVYRKRNQFRPDDAPDSNCEW